MNKKLRLASRRCVEATSDAEHIGVVDDFDVYETERGLVFVKTVLGWDPIDKKALREEFEDAITSWYIDREWPIDVPVRCDVVAFRVINEERAIIKYIFNAVEKDE